MPLTDIDAQRLGDSVADKFDSRNMIINGDMVIDQRNGGSSTTPSTDQTYVIDRWKIRNAGGAGRFSVEKSSSSPNNIDPSMLLTVTSTATPGASEFYAIEQAIEGYNFARTAAGTASSEILTLSFSVRSSLTGTYCCSVRNSGGGRSFVGEYTISAANTWENKTIEVPAITTGTWDTTTGTGAIVDWCLGAGSNFEGSTGWQSANRVATSNQVDWINSSGATFHLTAVQLEVGNTATPFERRSYGDELARCQRYYYECTSSTANKNMNQQGVLLAASATAYEYLPIPPVPMRVAPSCTMTDDVTAMRLDGGTSLIEVNLNGTDLLALPNGNGFSGHIFGSRKSGTGFSVGNTGRLCTGSTAGKLAFSAEL